MTLINEASTTHFGSMQVQQQVLTGQKSHFQLTVESSP